MIACFDLFPAHSKLKGIFIHGWYYLLNITWGLKFIWPKEVLKKEPLTSSRVTWLTEPESNWTECKRFPVETLLCSLEFAIPEKSWT